MKTILCFGDSNTYGFNPKDGSRYDTNSRWSGIFKQNLKDRFNVIEAGCNNRTCFINNPDGDEQTGTAVIGKYLTPQIDIIIIALGINDLQKFYNPSLTEIETGVENLINTAKKLNPEAAVIIASPSVIKECILNGYFSIQFDRNSIEKSKLIGNIYKNIAEKANCGYVDFNEVAEVSDIDGLHYDIDNHKKIAKYLTEYINNLTVWLIYKNKYFKFLF